MCAKTYSETRNINAVGAVVGLRIVGLWQCTKFCMRAAPTEFEKNREYTRIAEFVEHRLAHQAVGGDVSSKLGPGLSTARRASHTPNHTNATLRTKAAKPDRT